MPKINKVVTTVWYNKQNMHDLRRVFPGAEFVYVDFYDKERLTSSATMPGSTAPPGRRSLPAASQ